MNNHHHIRKHGMLRGITHVAASSSLEGRFGRMFRTLPKAKFPDDALNALAAAMSAALDFPGTPETEKDR